MYAQTMERQGLHRMIDELPDAAIERMAHYVAFLCYEEEAEEMEARYGATPNAETIAAIKELDEGRGEPVTIEGIMAALNADD